MVEKILKQFHKAVEKLDKFEAKMQSKSGALQEIEQKIADERTKVIAEGRRAAAIAKNIRSLISE